MTQKHKNFLNTLALVATLTLVGCASEPEKPAQEPAELPPVTEEPKVDTTALKRSLGLEGPVEDLGYKERAFDSCQAGYGFSSTKDCGKKVMAVVRFRLQCRDSEGTVATGLTAADLRPIAGQAVRWAMGGAQGSEQTDGEGYGEIEGIYDKSPKKERLRLAVGSQFLYMRAGEISRVVVPRPWCEQ